MHTEPLLPRENWGLSEQLLSNKQEREKDWVEVAGEQGELQELSELEEPVNHCLYPLHPTGWGGGETLGVFWLICEVTAACSWIAHAQFSLEQGQQAGSTGQYCRPMALPPAATPAQWARTWMPEAPAWLLPACQSHTTPTIYTEATSISRHFLTPGESAILCHPDNQTQEVKQSEKTEEYLSKEEKRKISRKKKTYRNRDKSFAW